MVARDLGYVNGPTPIKSDKYRAYRARKKAAGLREVRMWLPDTRTPEFRAEAKRQAALLDKTDDAGQTDDEREAAAMMERLTAEA